MDKEDVVDIYNGILLSHKKDGIVPFVATLVDLEIIYQVNQVAEIQIYDITSMWNLRK